jgi:hypothetical protein
MKWKIKDLQTRLYLTAVIILLAGLGSAIFIHLTAENVPDNNLVYQFESSKAYRHDLELGGGKMNVLADEFLRWFDSLWHGKPLASTVACITIIISFGFFFVAYHSPPT